MKKIYSLLLAMTSVFLYGQAQVSLISPNSTYTQNFDAMGTTSTLPPNWLAVKFSGTSSLLNGSPLTIGVTNGSASSGNAYNVGTTSASDRALGTLASGSIVPAFGTSFQNNTGSVIGSVSFSGFSEQWRSGSSSTEDEIILFEYSTDATSLTTGTWTALSSLNLVELLVSTTAAAAVNGNDAANRVAISGSIANLNFNAASTLWIRWRDKDNGGSDGIYALDEFRLTYTNPNAGGDITPPSISTLSPADNATGVSIDPTATITFNETVKKGTGNIYVKRVADNVVVQTIDVSTTAVTVNNTQVSFALTLANNTGYYIEVDGTAFKDLADNNFAGISGNTTWNFTTIAPPQDGILENTYTFNDCGAIITEGFKTINVTGAQVWTCVKFGRTYTADPSTDFAMEMNGFSGGAVQNEDWLISPKFDLSGTNIPLFDFYSATRFQGPALTLKISTDYSGTGNPSSATWTTINAKFPQEGSDTWILSDSINLSAFKTNNVHIAWVYTSSTAAAARWRIDDIQVYSSSKAALPSLEIIGSPLLDFRFLEAGTKSSSKTFNFFASDVTSDLIITAPDGFEVSKDGITFSSSILFTLAESNNTTNTGYVRFAPTAMNVVYAGALSITSDNINNTSLFVKGNTQPLTTTLQVVNWNIEWFGSTGQGPTNENLQMANAKKVMEHLDADVFGLAEIVSETSLATLTNSLSGDYSYVLGGFCSGGTSCASAQKMALVYKNSVVSNVTARPLLITSPTAVSNWSSGRMPYLVNADVTKNCETKNINFIVIHAKANTGKIGDQIESYHRRKEGLIELKDTLDTHFADANIIILGDFNDDLDRTIAPTTGADTVSSYQTMVADSTDGIHYTSVTLPLSKFGASSTTSFPEMIDHVIVSNELEESYLDLSASVYNDIEEVADVPDYASTTSDHYPILTRYAFNPSAPVISTCPTVDPVCVTATGTYTVPLFTATPSCGTLNYSFTITGATERTGESNDASGAFNIGTSTITWTATDMFGKSATCQTTVIVNAAPSVTIADAFALSKGTLVNTVYTGYEPASSITLTANATSSTTIVSYGWSNGATTESITVSPTSTTDYTVTVTDANGCTATATKTINVIDVRAGKKMDKVLVCQFSNKSFQTIQIDASAVAAHLVRGGMLGSCTSTMSSAITGTTMQELMETTLFVQVLPNPSASHFVIQTRGAAVGQVSYQVVDALGRIVDQSSNLPINNSFSIGNNYRPGIYLITVFDGKTRQTFRLVKTSN